MTPQRQNVKPPLEREIQKSIVQYLRASGWQVWQTSQGFRRDPGGTRMTPGIPDLYTIHPEHGAVWLEVKRGKVGRVSVAQRAFADDHRSCGNWTIPAVFCVRSLDDVRSLWRDMGWSREAAP